MVCRYIVKCVGSRKIRRRKYNAINDYLTDIVALICGVGEGLAVAFRDGDRSGRRYSAVCVAACRNRIILCSHVTVTSLFLSMN